MAHTPTYIRNSRDIRALRVATACYGSTLQMYRTPRPGRYRDAPERRSLPHTGGARRRLLQRTSENSNSPTLGE
jgi:hypothetical protein